MASGVGKLNSKASDGADRPATAGELAVLFDGLSLRLLAGTAALLLGAIYAYGAIVKAGELRAAGQAVGDTLPLVPLEQLLVLGINAVLPLAAVAIVLLLIVMALTERVAAHASDAEAGAKEPKSRPRKRLPRWVVWVGAGFWLAWTFVSVEPIAWILFAQILAGSWYARSRHTTPKANALFGLSAVTITLAAMAYLSPAPLADISLTTYGGRELDGELIAATGTNWYIALADDRWTAIEGRTVERVDVTAGEKGKQHSLYEEITGSNFLGLGP